MTTTTTTTTTTTANQDDDITVVLLIPPEHQAFALAVRDVLHQQFGISHVLVRSSHTPSDRLLPLLLPPTNADNNNPDSCPPPAVLYVALGPSTSSTAILESESPAPILSLPANNDDSATTTALAIAKYGALTSPPLRQRVVQAVWALRQARLVQDAQVRSTFYTSRIAACLDDGKQGQGHNIMIVGEQLAAALPSTWPHQRGKVRDRYDFVTTTPSTTAAAAAASSLQQPQQPQQQLIALVTTDRQSGFDRMLAVVPYKGAVLNLTSAFWFQQTAHLIPNHLVAVPHPNVSICAKCVPFPIEFVVRAYLTGSTSTSIWHNYQAGVRTYCGHDLPDGLVKNQKLPCSPILTPTTKQDDHDRPISTADIVAEQWMTQADLDVCAKAALEIFALGQRIAWQHGLILVDTKYEFGVNVVTGQICLIDEVHTPDSSRYWLASTYDEKFQAGLEPDNIDKEFLRLWFRDHCDPYNTAVALPEAPRDLVLELSRRYITLYEMITWQDFDFGSAVAGGEEAIAKILLEQAQHYAGR